ncbi:unnamed protein product [Kuraishia capsulata CBS 1993]|uniref:Succinate/fumarate mitochondrial transporter n=1 Tax=Kuraishia capsulata CBS 1993 TaxID=1382522 RepID=W6MK54_9ASCO|nr:uncharacterized protein KUCA_T00002345001 [Kuraishia capsulata CBS 1993]CDK26373.1 unnamed protein product [Kuraishia capsulata CBS 1993]
MTNSKQKNSAVDLIAGGTAGLFEALCCHPLDTIKVRMQLYRRAAGLTKNNKPPGFVKTGLNISRKESPLALYKGLGAVVIGIVPKMGIRFSSYEFYRTALKDSTTGKVSTGNTFLAGVGAGITEAVFVVNPMEVIKIRLQAQHHSMTDPLDIPKYRNAAHCLFTVVREEGFGTLYRGVALTAARQASNQGVNFTVYSKLREHLQSYHGSEKLPGWETSLIGLFSGALGPLSNAPLDTIKTRMQRESGKSTEGAVARVTRIASRLIQEEGAAALYKGITPRIMRVAPGQAVTFTVYEYMKGALNNMPYIGSQVAVFDE